MRHYQSVVALLLLVFTAPRAASGQDYITFDLGAFIPSEINDRFQIVGRCGQDACVLDPGGMRSLGVSAAFGGLHINASGDVAGVTFIGNVRRPFVWRNGVLAAAPAPPGDVDVLELTDTGWLLLDAGRSYLAVGDALIDLTAIFGGDVQAINAQGMLGGLAGGRAFIRRPDGRIEIPWATANAVSLIGPNGHFAGGGSSFFPPFDWHYSPPLGPVTTIVSNETLGPLGLGTVLRGINAAGDLVGFFHHSGGRFTPFLYRGGVFSFPQASGLPAGFRLLSVSSINDAGAIVGIAANPLSPPQRGVLLVPRPQPPAAIQFRVDGRVVTLQWAQMPGAVDYIVEAGTAPSSANVFNGSVGLQTTVAAAPAPGRYYVRVRSRTIVGLSGPSAEIVIDVP